MTEPVGPLHAAVMAPALVLGASLAYLLALFAVAWWADRRAAAGRSVIGDAWVDARSMAVYCTAWTYFGSVGRAASGGVWFLPIYLGPTLAMVLAWLVLRKMVRIARTWRITSIADFIASRYGKSRLLAGLVTLIALVGVVPYVALQLKAVASGYALLTGHAPGAGQGAGQGVLAGVDGTLLIALVLAGFTIAFGTRHLDNTERHEGMVAAIAAESVVKLLAFLMVGGFVTWGLFSGPGDLFARAMAQPEIARVLRADPARPFAFDQWFALLVLAGLSVLLLPRQFQVMVVENVDERHIRRAAWAFPAYQMCIRDRGVSLGQIAKSVIFRRRADEAAVLVVTSGDRRVDEKRVAAITGPLGRADADFVKARTGFSIGGVSPLAHAWPCVTLIDRDLYRFDLIWAAAGHPNGVFRLSLIHI